MKHTNTIIRRRDLPAYLGCSAATLGNLLNPRSKYFRADFPKKIRISTRVVGFLLSELDAWIASQKQVAKEEGV